MSDCLSCSHAKPCVGPDGRIDFNQRRCEESPPQVVVLGVDANRQPVVQGMFPIVGKGVRCDRHDERLIGESVIEGTKAK